MKMSGKAKEIMLKFPAGPPDNDLSGRYQFLRVDRIFAFEFQGNTFFFAEPLEYIRGI
jgi:hypothetical protein